MSNLIYDEATNNKTVKWCLNLPAIVANYPELVSFDQSLEAYSGPALFINGDFSTNAM